MAGQRPAVAKPRRKYDLHKRHAGTHTPPYVRAAAERLYVSTFLSVEEITAQVAIAWPDNPITPDMVARWAKKGKWKRPEPPKAASVQRNPVPVTVGKQWDMGWQSWME